MRASIRGSCSKVARTTGEVFFQSWAVSAPVTISTRVCQRQLFVGRGGNDAGGQAKRGKIFCTTLVSGIIRIGMKMDTSLTTKPGNQSSRRGAAKLPPLPSSNRTGGFPASGLPENFSREACTGFRGL